MKKLVINADDFGFCPSVSAGIMEALCSGAITDFSFMLSLESFKDSLALIGKNRIERCGIHLNLTAGSSVGTGRTFGSLKNLITGLATGKIAHSEVLSEIDYQIHALSAANLEITHIDSHQNIHLLPFIFDHLRKYAESEGRRIPIRVPFELPSHPLSMPRGNVFRLSALSLLSLVARGKYIPPTTVIGQNFFNNAKKARVFKDIVAFILSSKKTSFEFPIHPGYCVCIPDLRACNDTYTAMRTAELSYMAEHGGFFIANGIQHVSFGDLIASS